MVAPTRRRRCRPRPSGLVLAASVLFGLTLLAGLMVLANAVAATTGTGAAGSAAPPSRPERAVGAAGDWEWPLDGEPEPLRGFEAPRSEWGRGHRGVDLPARPGEVVRAAGGGIVTWAGRVAGRGVVTVTHDGGLRTTYEPVAGQVPVGARVAPGAAIGVLEPGVGHCPGRPCLHWGLLRGRAYLDPLALLDRGRPVLLPFWPPAAR